MSTMSLSTSRFSGVLAGHDDDGVAVLRLRDGGRDRRPGSSGDTTMASAGYVRRGRSVSARGSRAMSPASPATISASTSALAPRAGVSDGR